VADDDVTAEGPTRLVDAHVCAESRPNSMSRAGMRPSKASMLHI
jgi:hypothetical protein